MDNLEYINTNNLNWSYLAKGDGNAAVICLHGFGRTANDFFHLNWKEELKIISLNLPLHGETNFTDNRQISSIAKTEFYEVIRQIARRELIDEMYLVGYSLGGKIVLSLLEFEDLNIKGAYLFAPDGFKSNPWYRFASQTAFGEYLNKQNIKYPFIFYTIVTVSRILGLASKRQITYASHHTKDKQKRTRLFNIWKAHRNLSPNLQQVKHCLSESNIDLHIVLGKFDKIIPIEPIQKWSNGQKQVFLSIENCGHTFSNQLLEKYLSILISAK